MLHSKRLVLFGIAYQYKANPTALHTACFSDIVKKVNTDQQLSLLTPISVTGELELIATCIDTQAAVQVIFALEEACTCFALPFKLQYALSLGTITTPLNTKDSLQLSGPAIDKAKDTLLLNNSRKRFHPVLDDSVKGESLYQAFDVFQEIVDNWNSVPNKQDIAVFFQSNKKLQTATAGIHRARNEMRYRIKEYYAIKNMIGFLAQ